MRKREEAGKAGSASVKATHIEDPECHPSSVAFVKAEPGLKGFIVDDLPGICLVEQSLRNTSVAIYCPSQMFFTRCYGLI